MRWTINGVACLVGVSVLIACSSEGGSGRTIEKDEWKLAFAWDGADVELPLEHMHVYLVEEEDQYPEVFEIAGDGVALVGTFPMESHVGYEENWPVIFGKSIDVAPSGGARDDKLSFIQLPDGTKAFVTGGTLWPEKLEGSVDGLEGDKTLYGTFTLRVRTGAGEEEITGRFAVHCLTLG
jgi:hypothetical protein